MVEKKPNLIGKITLQKGQRIFEYNRQTKEIIEASFEFLPLNYKEVKTNNLAYYAHHKNQSTKKILVNPNCVYIPSLNKKNVIKALKRDFNIDLI